MKIDEVALVVSRSLERHAREAHGSKIWVHHVPHHFKKNHFLIVHGILNVKNERKVSLGLNIDLGWVIPLQKNSDSCGKILDFVDELRPKFDGMYNFENSLLNN